MEKTKNVNEYIKKAPKEHQPKLIELRKIIQKTVQKADEEISYGMPAYKWKEKPLLYFAGMKRHLGFYPTPSGVKIFEDELIKQGISF